MVCPRETVVSYEGRMTYRRNRRSEVERYSRKGLYFVREEGSSFHLHIRQLVGQYAPVSCTDFVEITPELCHFPILIP
jgi:hypothetical protein